MRVELFQQVVSDKVFSSLPDTVVSLIIPKEVHNVTHIRRPTNVICFCGS